MQMTVCYEVITPCNKRLQGKLLCLPVGQLCIEKQHTVTSCVTKAAEEALGQHSDKFLSRAMGRTQGFFFFLTFFCYRPQHSNLF